MALEDEILVLTKDGDTAIFEIVGGELVITLTGVSALVVNKDGERLRVEGDSVRVDGGGRLELHADNVLRADAGGTGFTFTGSAWSFYYPDHAVGWMKAPPEHPDHGGVAYDATAGDLYDDQLEDYYDKFPEERP